MAEEGAPRQPDDGNPRFYRTSFHPNLSAADGVQKRSRSARRDETSGMPAIMSLYFGSGGRADEVFLLGRLQRSLTDATLWQVRRRVGRAWQTMLALHVGKAFELIALIEPALGDLPLEDAEQIRIEVDMLRALGLTLQDDSLAALPLALSAARQSGRFPIAQVASTICRLGYWKLGDLDSFYALPRIPPGTAIGRRQAISAVFDLSIEAAVEVEQLHFCAAKRLALDALDLAEASAVRDDTVAAFPASLVAQVLYEQGYLDEAEDMIRDLLPAIKR
jgi:hypothetical protein